ncbi:heme ABC transporter permease [Litorivivens sp.]|uniref:heme ABC transporter permease n=1 Tax=Litorivivens sp. TaxID=2020868 RepID=UPI003564651F
MWAWFHKWSSPRWFYQLSGRLLPWLAVISAVCLLVGVAWGLLYVPPDYKQGNSFRIIYIHVPAAAVAMAGYMMMAIAGAISLVWRIKLADMVVKCAAPIGAALTFLALVTGAIWGKPTWGTWWVWDARITSVLVLFFLYIGIIALYEAFENKEAAGRACAILALVGAVNIPIIYWSVEWWYSLHQPASISFTGESSIHPSMLRPLMLTITGFYAFFGVALLMFVRNEILDRERNTRWVRELVTAAAR